MIKIQYRDENITREYDTLSDLFFDALFENRITFNQITTRYVEYLETLKYAHEKQLSEIDMPLINVIKPMEHLKGKPAVDAIYRYLVKYERFKGAPVWDELVQYVGDNNINIKGSYFVDLYLEGNNER